MVDDLVNESSSAYSLFKIPKSIRGGSKFVTKNGYKIDVLEVYCVAVSSTPDTQYTWIKYSYRTPTGQIGSDRAGLYQFIQLMLTSDFEKENFSQHLIDPLRG